MDKRIAFMAFNPEKGVISGADIDANLSIGKGTFSVPTSIRLPQSELDRFKMENSLQFNKQYKVYTFGGKNPVLLLKNCILEKVDNHNTHTYTAETWEWV